MAYSQKTKASLRKSFINGIDIKTAAACHNVNYQTARNWKDSALKNGDDWDQARAAARIAKGGLGDATAIMLDEFSHLVLTTTEELKNNQDIDPIEKTEALGRLANAYTKVMAGASTGNIKISRLSVALEVITMLSDYIAEHYPDKKADWLEILEPFGAEINKAFSS